MNQINLKEITFSAIIPTYNRADWLEYSIQSILDQDDELLELIVVDDGSTDNTKEIVEKYDGVKYLYQSQKGPSAARNSGAKLAKGTHLAFLDSDDRWEKGKLYEQRKFLENHQHINIVYTDEIWIRNGVRVNRHKHHYKIGGWIYLDCLPLCRIAPSSIVIKRDLFINNEGFDESLIIAEDYDLWLRLAAENEIGFCDKNLIKKYGGHDDQLSKKWGMDKNRVYSLEKILSSGKLKEEYALPTIQNLVDKLKILIIVYNKHNKKQDAEIFKKKLDEFEKEIENLNP